MTDVYQVSNYTPCQIGLVKGERGTNGANGANGINGKDGQDGKDGLRGLSGSDGKSVYQLAVDNGFVGTFDDYQETLRGEKGLKGDAGVDAAIDSLTVSTGAAGTSASVVTGGTPISRTFALTIPRGDKGDKGDGGSFLEKSYRTYAEMETDKPNIPANVSTRVTNDSDATKNGSYTYDGVIFTRSQYDSKTVTDKIVSDATNAVNDAINNTAIEGGILADTFVTATANGVGSVARTQRDKNSEKVSVKDFGAKGDGVTDDTVAIKLACQYIQSNKGGVLFFPYSANDYIIESELGETLFVFDDLDYFVLDGENVTIRDTQTYSRVIQQETKFLVFSNCRKIHYTRGVRLISQTYDADLNTKYSGINWGTFYRGCDGVAFYSEMYGGIRGLNFYRDNTDPTDFKSKNIIVDCKVTHVRYAYGARWSGTNAKVRLRTEEVGRSFFLYDVHDVDLHIVSKNVGTSLISAYSGKGCSNIKIYYEDLESDKVSGSNAADKVSINIEGSEPVTMDNIDIEFNVANYSGGWGHTLSINKYYGGVNPDEIGRGHVINNLRVSGNIVGWTGTNAIILAIGKYAYPDVLSNWSFDNLTVDGGSFNLRLGDVLKGVFKVNNLTALRNTVNIVNSTGVVEFTNCNAVAFSNSTTDTSKQRYIDCVMSNPINQSYINKEFISTVTGNNVVNALSSTGLLGSTKSAKIVAGDLSTPTNIFKISNRSSGLFKLTYFLIKESNVTSPSTRAEKFGTKRWTGSSTSTGVALFQTAVVDDTVEGVLNDFAEPLEVTLVNGDSTGFYIAVSCAGLTSTLSKAVFSLEATTIEPFTNIEPVLS